MITNICHQFIIFDTKLSTPETLILSHIVRILIPLVPSPQMTSEISPVFYIKFPFVETSPPWGFRKIELPPDFFVCKKVLHFLALPYNLHPFSCNFESLHELSDIIIRGLVLRVMKTSSFLWNCATAWSFVTSKWTALEAAHVNIKT